ncbi:EAL domain-containing protein [Colwellia sp. 1_MG-2023]|uniref:GGDEF/EAL domain-containing response regulator n=1 Tax=Colwellia sp. 1_MG-2023 TaxID=3062649 RepID=UPI0026E28444|nr:GGDEF domain-containing response regulator [Colwellia sp. 1_MG-2023]MDO6446523.1 EAL domain-containing protein [Colwellia sp. 1_MG-2023]
MIILLIISNDAIRNRVNIKLEFSGHTIIQTSNSADAITLLRTKKVDLVITEVDIGKIDGWRLSRLIRTGILAASEDIPILLITENYSERIAETTARMFDIDRVIAYQELDIIQDVVNQMFSGTGTLNKKQKILVIEDTEDTANLVHRMLKHKFSVDIAVDGIDGIKAFRKNSYDIVLLDIMMPGMSGDEVLDVLIELNPKQVVIAMTAHGTIDLAELMLVKGASDYIQKPFKAEQLRKVCDIAAKREDFLISNAQFIAKALALKDEQRRYNSLSKDHYRVLDSLNSVVIELSTKGRIMFVNNAWFKLSGFTVSETIGKSFTDFIHGNNSNLHQYVEEACAHLLSGTSSHESLEVQLLKKNGLYFCSEVSFSPYYKDDELIGISGTIDDITVRKNAEERLKHIALHDMLTGINNRHFFDDKLRNISTDTKRSSRLHSLLYIDLDHFKVINDSQGHHQGDLVLKEIARLLSERVRQSDVLCRIGGDEFAFLLMDTNVDDAKNVALELCKTIADSSFKFADKVYKVSCSIGISAIDGKSASSDTYLQQADIAMFAAKQKGRNRAHIFSDEDRVTGELKQSFEWVQKLQNALFDDNIILHFQPIIDVNTNKIECYEALVRLIVDGKIIFPNDFIPSLEKAEDMNLLDRHVIGKALKMMKDNAILKRVAINLSAQAFTDDRLFTFIEEKLVQYNIDPSMVIFELTETASLSNITGTQRMVTRLNELGCHFSIDDFGTGFSTFAYLKQIPAGSVKIDGSFVKDMLKDPIDEVLVKAINDTAHALGKTTVAEFVEDEDTLIKLKELGVDYAQGYYIAKPKDIDEIHGHKVSPLLVVNKK